MEEAPTILQEEPGIDRILSYVDVERLTNLKRSTFLKLENEGLFPRRVKLTHTQARSGKVGWKLSRVQRWIAELGEEDQ